LARIPVRRDPLPLPMSPPPNHGYEYRHGVVRAVRRSPFPPGSRRAALEDPRLGGRRRGSPRRSPNYPESRRPGIRGIGPLRHGHRRSAGWCSRCGYRVLGRYRRRSRVRACSGSPSGRRCQGSGLSASRCLRPRLCRSSPFPGQSSGGWLTPACLRRIFE